VASTSCHPPTAIPGTSRHEQGLAIDFANCQVGTAVNTWLKNNAARFKIYNYPRESWHWSFDGD
jgi:LAS superfamily LD-carboxypeptidase LdcB